MQVTTNILTNGYNIAQGSAFTRKLDQYSVGLTLEHNIIGLYKCINDLHKSQTKEMMTIKYISIKNGYLFLRVSVICNEAKFFNTRCTNLFKFAATLSAMTQKILVLQKRATE